MSISVEDLLSIDHVAVRNRDALRRKKFSDVCTDSRQIQRGALFVALRGEKLDGHKFVEDAFRDGAACAVVDRQEGVGPYQDQPLLIVKDTTKALGQLANVWRKKFDIPFIAIAGSNGKTTTKEMMVRVLQTQYSVLGTKGNFNNHVGVPKTLFHLTRKHEIAVIEVGTNHPGELTYLCDIIEPTHGLVTNIGREHLEFFKDLRGVTKAEGELFTALGTLGHAFVNADDVRVVRRARRLRKKTFYGFSNRRAHVHGKLLGVNAKGCARFSVKAHAKRPFDVELRTPGLHATSNALAAVTVGISFGVSVANIRRAFDRFTPPGKRMEVLKAGGVTILNDTYNANPDSVLSALETLKMMNSRGRKIVVLADMLELGAASRKEHGAIGKALSAMEIEFLMTYGPMAKFIHEHATVGAKFHYDEKNMLAEYAAELLAPGDIILVKGSRGMKMEDVVIFLQERLRKKKE